VDLHLSDKVAIVTGASKGIGLAVTHAFFGEGARVVGGAREFGDEPASDADNRIHRVSVDLSTADGPGLLVDSAVQRYGSVDILVNNVGATRPRLAGFSR